MAHKIIWAVLLTALSSGCMQQSSSPTSTDKNSAEAKTLQKYKESDTDDWREFDEKTDALSPRTPVPAKPILANSARFDNYLEGLKQRPDAHGYDSDEEILKRFEAPNSAKK